MQICAYDFEVDGIYYNFIPGTEDEVEVTGEYEIYTPVWDDDEIIITLSDVYPNPKVGYEDDAMCILPVSYEGDVVIPSTVTYSEKTYNVTRIGEYAFSDCWSLISVSIPNSIISIERQAFWGCITLASITIPNSVISIKDGAFISCNTLKSVTLSNSLISLGDNAFIYCQKLNSIEIPASVKNIGSNVFTYCDGLTAINVDAENPYFTSEEGVLYNKAKTNLITLPLGKEDTTFSIPNSVKIINRYAFSCNNKLTSIIIPNSVITIGRYAFYNCSSISSITIPESVIMIEDNAFSGCYNLQTVEVEWNNPSDVTLLDSPFSHWSNPSILIVPANTKHLYRNAPVWNSFKRIMVKGENPDFDIENNVLIKYYGNAETVTIPEEVTEIGENAFSYSNINSVILPENLTHIRTSAFEGCYKLDSISFPKSLINIESRAFRNSGLTSITLPSNIEDLGEEAFGWCSSLKTVIVEWETPLVVDNLFSDMSLLDRALMVPTGTKSLYREASGWKDFGFICEEEGELDFQMNGNVLVKYVGTKREVIIPDYVEVIGEYAFHEFRYITSAVLPESITKIEKNAFLSCHFLTSINLPEALTEIEEGAFQACVGLKNIVLPKQLTDIGANAFTFCSNLETVEVEWDTPLSLSRNRSVFSSVDLSKCTLIVPRETKTLYEKAIVWKDFGVIKGKGETAIANINSSFNVYLSEKNLYINSLVSETISVYSMNGNCLLSTQKSEGEIQLSLENIQDKILIVQGSSGWSKKIIQ